MLFGRMLSPLGPLRPALSPVKLLHESGCWDGMGRCGCGLAAENHEDSNLTSVVPPDGAVLATLPGDSAAGPLDRSEFTPRNAQHSSDLDLQVHRASSQRCDEIFLGPRFKLGSMRTQVSVS